MTLRLALMVCALLLFLAAALNVPSTRFNLIAAGLFFWALSLVLVAG